MARSPSAWCAGASPGDPGLRLTGAGGQEGQFTFKDLRFNRAFVNDAQGNALYVNQAAGRTNLETGEKAGRIQNLPSGYLGGWIGNSLNPGHVQRQLVANGQVLGRFGDAPDRINNPTRPDAAPKYVHTTDFQLEAQVLNLKGASVDPVSYTVVGGETLRDVARNVLGDASLWWRIADANALAVSADAPLTAGQTLSVPKLALNANSAETFQPYDPSKITGSLEPTLPMPAQGDKCGGMGKIIMAVVAIAVAAVTQQWYLANFTTISGGVAGAISQGAYGALAASGAVGGAAGSIASQAVGVAIGAQEGFSWKGVAMGALAGGISSGLAGTQLLGGSSWQMTAVRMATANALTQGVAVATGLQKSFDWRGVAAAAVGGGVGAAVNGALGGYTLPEGMAGPQIPAAFSGLGEFGGGLARGTLSGMAAGTAAAIARGGKVAIQQVATDAFGNALGSSLLDYASNPGSPVQEPLSNARESFRISEIQEQNWNARKQKALALSGPGRWDDDMPLSAADQYVQNFGGEVLNVAARSDNLTGPSYNGISAIAGQGTSDDPRISGTVEVRESAGKMLPEDLRRFELESRNRNEQIEPTTGSALADEAIERAAGTVLGVAGIMHGGAQLATDQVWAIGNAVTGGWLANNVPAAQAATARNIELGNSLLNLPGQISRGALRAVTGNWHGAAQSASNALQLNQIQAANARGDYLSAQVMTTQSAINVAGLAMGGVGAARAGLGMAAVQDAAANLSAPRLLSSQFGGVRIGNTASTSSGSGFVRFSGDFDAHILNRDFGVPAKRGIGGAHNLDEFMRYSNEFKIVGTVDHPTVDGIQTISYQVAARDPAGKFTGAFRDKVFEKTVFDPSVISPDTFLTWGRQAAAEGQALGPLNRTWTGTAPNGLRFMGYLDDTGAVRSFFPDF